jgi:hypothetical protein
MSLDCCPPPPTETISLFQGQLKWEVIYLPHGQVQILEFECVKNLHIFTIITLIPLSRCPRGHNKPRTHYNADTLYRRHILLRTLYPGHILTRTHYTKDTLCIHPME